MKERTGGLVMPKTCESCEHYCHAESSMYKSCGHASNLRFTSRKNDSMPEIIQKPEEKNPYQECIFHLPKKEKQNGKGKEFNESVIDAMIEIFVSFTSFPFMFVGIIVGIAHNGAAVGYEFGEALWKLYMKKKGVKDER